MSPVVDNRVVEMEFDNSRFERNVSTSISTLDKLKNALRLDGAAKGLQSIENTTRNFNLDSIGSAVETISSKFSLMGMIGFTALQRIAQQAVATGEKLIKAMTFDQFDAGFKKYEEKTTAVQTIMSATGDTWRQDANDIANINRLIASGMDPSQAEKYADVWQQFNDGTIKANAAAKELNMTQNEFLETVERTKDAMAGYDGSQMDYVNSQMEKLNWFTDETSYNFNEMVNNIGKFTANNIPLSQATTAMQGIATWAAVSGQNAATASRAMYNMAQAIGVGSVKLMDWKSIENANMATAEFKKHAMDSAVAMNMLKQEADGTYKTLKGTTVTVENFSQTLSEGWFNKSVLLDTLDAYGGFTDSLYQVSEASGLTASQLLGLVEAQEKGTLTQAMINEVAAEGSMSSSELAKKVEELAGSEFDLGRKAFRAAQEAKTFHDAIDATKDAASTKWMNIFENIFGDYERARHLWTDFAEFLYDTLVAPLEKVEELSQAFKSPFDGFTKSLRKTSEASQNTKADLLDLVRAQREGTLSQEQLNEVAEKGAMDAEELQSRVEALASDSFGELTDGIFELSDSTGIATDKLLEFVQAQQNGTLETKALEAAAEEAGIPVEDLATSIETLATETNKSGLDRVIEGLKGIAGLLFNGNGESAASNGILGSLIKGFQRVIPPLNITKESIVALINRFREWGQNLKLTGSQMSALRNAGQGLASIILYIGNTIKNFWNATETLRTSLVNLATAIGNLVLKLFGSAKDMDTAGASAEGFQKICDKLAGVIDKVAEAINGLNLEELKDKFSGVTNVLKTLKGALDWVIDKFTSIDFAGGIGKAVDWIKDKFEKLKEFFSGFDWGTAFKGLLGGGVLALVAGKLMKLWHNFESPLTAFDGMKDKVSNILDGIKTSLNAFQTGVRVDAIKKIATAILILAAALLVLGFVNYEKATVGVLMIAAIMFALYEAMQAIDGIDKAKMATLAASMLIAAAAMLVLAVALGVLAGALALFALVAKMDTITDGLMLMGFTLGIVVLALYALSKMSPKVIIAAAALMILSAAMLVLAAALAAFAAVAKMDTIAEGLLYMAATLAVAIAGLMVLATAGPMILVAAAAILIVSASLLILAGALAAFAAIAGMENAWAGLGMLVVVLAALTIALMALAATGPMVIVGAAALLVAAAACLVLAAAVAVVGLALPLLAIGLAALGSAIGSTLTSIGEGAQNFLTSLSDALVAIGEALGEIITTIAGSLGEAVSLLGEGIAEAITAVIASVGEGIAQGLTAISDAIGTFGENLTNASLGIENFGESIRSLKGIDWTGTALGIGELALAFKKLKPQDLAESMGPAAQSIIATCTQIATAMTNMSAQVEIAGQNIATSFATGIQSNYGAIQLAVQSLIDSTATAFNVAIPAATATFETAGRNLINGFVTGINTAVDRVTIVAANLVQLALQAITVEGNITESSEKATDLGKRFGNGFVKGLELKKEKAKDMAKQMADAVLEGLTSKEEGATDAGGAVADAYISGFSAAAGLNTEGTEAAGQTVGASFTAGLEAGASGADAAGQNIGASITSGLEGASGDASTAGQELGSSVTEGIESTSGEAETAGQTLGSSGASAAQGTSGEFTSAGQFLGQGLAQGLLSALGEVQAAAQALADAAADAIAAAAEINSPSKVTARLGGFFGQGFVNGISDKIGAAEHAAEDMVNRTADTISNARSIISSILEDDFTPVITPVLDTSSIEGSLSGMSRFNVSAGLNQAQSIGTVRSPAVIQNGTSSGPATAVLSESAVRALASGSRTPNKTVIEFTGDLAQLARILHPVILDEYNYHGDSLVK